MDRLEFVEWNIQQLKNILKLSKDSIIMQVSYSSRLQKFEKEKEQLLNEKK